MLSVSFDLSNPRRPKDTRENILQTKEFTVNIISEPFIEAANSTAVESPADMNEWLLSGLTQAKSVSARPFLKCYGCWQVLGQVGRLKDRLSPGCFVRTS